MPAPCGHAPPSRTCHLCRLARDDPRYAAWRGETTHTPTPRLPDCAELGPVLPGQGNCGCAVKLRKCSLHVVCTATPRDAAAGPVPVACSWCPQHSERATP